MPLQRNEFLPQDLVTVYTSPSGLMDTRTGYPYQMGGLVVGGYFDLTEQEAQLYGRNQLHSGRYRFVQIDSGANAAQIVVGSIGLLKTLALGVNFITSYDKGLAPGIRPAVFINAPTAAQVAAGCWVFIQEQGDATLLAGGTIALGALVQSQAGGTVITGGGGTATEIGIAESAGTSGNTFRALLTSYPVIQG